MHPRQVAIELIKHGVELLNVADSETPEKTVILPNDIVIKKDAVTYVTRYGAGQYVRQKDVTDLMLYFTEIMED